MTRIWEFIRYTYLSIDPRSLGLFRIVFGCVLLCDLYSHWQVIDFWYTDDGMLPGASVLANPLSRRVFSLFFLTTSHAGVALGMVICGCVYLAYTLGWRTRLFQWLALIAVVSINGRVAPLENGGDTVLNLLAMWTLFLPVGRRFSLDVLLRSLRSRVEYTPAQLEDREALAPDVSRVVSIAVLAVLLQFACIYLFSGIQKNGFTWQEGTAVHYALNQDRIVTVFGVWLREQSPLLLALAGWATVVIEVAGAALILSPLWSRHTRLVAIVMLPLMHLGFALCLNIGSFSYAMMSFFPLLLATEHWEAATGYLARRTHRRTVFFDSECGICFLLARVLARIDAFSRLRFVSNRQDLPNGITPEIADKTIVVVNEGTGRVSTRSAAWADVFRALPFGIAIAWMIRLPIVRIGVDRIYDAVSNNRIAISRRLGLAACGIPAQAPENIAAPQPASPRAAGLLRVATVLMVAVMMTASYGQLVQHNFAIPPAMRYRQPEWLQMLVDYPRLHQGWLMFTPEGPPQEFMLAVEAVTEAGRHVDPFNEVASRHSVARFERIPVRLGFDQFFSNYSQYYARSDLRAYQPALVRWILAYPQRTQNPDDRIVRFELIKIADISPAVGKRSATNLSRIVLLRYPEPDAAEKTGNVESRSG
ncbi:MAG: DCC1-like thiol-disulfide oxidoreductase family protein [Myxococcota bacterium]